jgi:hypothetical protein
VVYDDLFTTVPNAESGGLFRDEPFDPATWDRVVQSGIERAIDSEDEQEGLRVPELSDEWLMPEERQEQQNQQQNRQQPLPVRQQQPTLAPEGARDARDGIPVP